MTRPRPPRWFWWEVGGGTAIIYSIAGWSLWRARRLTRAWRQGRTA